jgi:hypothetical protein
MPTLICKFCNKSFVSNKRTIKYCSDKCLKQKKLAYWREFYQKNKEYKKSEARRRLKEDGDKIRSRRRELYKIDNTRHKKTARKSYLKRRDKVIEKQKIYYRKNADEILLKHKKWASKNRDRINEWTENYRSTPEGKIAHSLRNRIRLAIKGQGAKKDKTSLKLVGCTLKFLKNHIEKKFKPGMTWENYGLLTWHLDHIKPVSKFNLLDPEEQKRCFHYTNLQPLWAKENIKKSNKY